MTTLKGVLKIDDTRSSFVRFVVDPPREVNASTPRFDGDDGVIMVTDVLVTCTWLTGGYNFISGYPFAAVTGDEGERLSVTDLTHIPDWLSEIIAAGTPTGLESPVHD